MSTALPPLPVTLLAGFLGSGKTTLVNRILAEQHGRRIAVVVNEFGDVGIDGRLVVGTKDEIVELANGCVCCSVRGDLSATLRQLVAARRRRFRRRPLERILIEASGLASPGPAVQTLFIDPEIEGELRFDGVVTLVHAGLIVRQLAEHPEASEQVAYADRLLVNHVDRVDTAQLEECERALRSCNPATPIHRCERADVPLSEVLDLDPGRPRLPQGEATRAVHTSGVGAVTLTSTQPLDLHRLKMWLQFLATRRTHEIMRLKGILSCSGRPESVVVQGVYQWLELGPGAEPPPATSTLVLIGRDLDAAELERGWRSCGATTAELS